MDNLVTLSCGREVDASDAVEITFGFRRGTLIHVGDSISTYDGEVVHSDDAYYCDGDGEYYADSSDLIYVDNGSCSGYYFSDDVVHAEDTCDFYHVDDIGNYVFEHSDGCYYTEEERTERCHSYHSGYRPMLTTDDTKFTIGFEVEKEDEEVLDNWDLDNVDDTKWSREEDGSLDSNSGFELVSPTYDLMTDDLDTDVATDILSAHINAKFSDNCGGHINFGIKGLDGQEVYDKVKGFVPVLLSLYQARLRSRWCPAKKSYNDSKYSAVVIKGSYIEFRAPSAVISVTNLLWRRDLLRIMASNLDKGTLFFIREMLTPTSALHKHLLKVVSAPTIYRRAAFAAALAEKMTGTDYAKYVSVEGFGSAVENMKPRAESMIRE
jgi:hypothetical protein